MIEKLLVIDNFLDPSDWNEAVKIVKSPGWHYANWENHSGCQWIKYLHNEEFFTKTFVEKVNATCKKYNLQANSSNEKFIRANSTGYAVGGNEHIDFLQPEKKDWYTFLWYCNEEYHPSWGGSFYCYIDNNIHSVIPIPNRAIIYHGQTVHSWNPYLKYDGQRLNVALSLKPIKDENIYTS